MRGVGKTTLARILAKALNCVHGPTREPDNTCVICREITEGIDMDVREIDAATYTGVDSIRDLRDVTQFQPARDRYRIFIIDEAHMVTTQGFNALLKIVEEPPEHLIFVFATTEPDKVLSTIRSRTHHYPFRLIPPAALRELLERICTEEHVTVEPAVYPLVIRAGGGSVRDTLSVLDQLLAGAGEEGITYARAVALLGVTLPLKDQQLAGCGEIRFGVLPAECELAQVAKVNLSRFRRERPLRERDHQHQGQGHRTRKLGRIGSAGNQDSHAEAWARRDTVLKDTRVL